VSKFDQKSQVVYCGPLRLLWPLAPVASGAALVVAACPVTRPWPHYIIRLRYIWASVVVSALLLFPAFFLLPFSVTSCCDCLGDCWLLGLYRHIFVVEFLGKHGKNCERYSCWELISSHSTRSEHEPNPEVSVALSRSVTS